MRRYTDRPLRLLPLFNWVHLVMTEFESHQTDSSAATDETKETDPEACLWGLSHVNCQNKEKPLDENARLISTRDDLQQNAFDRGERLSSAAILAEW